MNIIEKLNLQGNLGGIVLFKDGVFLRAYNESSYILTRLLKQDLKIKCYQVKQYNQWVTMCGFPHHKLNERLPKAVRTNFGGQLMGDYDLSGYHTWFSECCHQARVASAVTTAHEKDAQAAFTWAAKVGDDSLTNVTITLTLQQFIHLLHWQPGYYHPTVEEEFIGQLKHQTISICVANMIKDNQP